MDGRVDERFWHIIPVAGSSKTVFNTLTIVAAGLAVIPTRDKMN